MPTQLSQDFLAKAAPDNFDAGAFVDAALKIEGVKPAGPGGLT